jgi:diacylglycerol kinase family enzyme
MVRATATATVTVTVTASPRTRRFLQGKHSPLALRLARRHPQATAATSQSPSPAVGQGRDRPGQMRAALIVNPVRVRDPARLRRRCAEASAARGWRPPLLLQTSLQDPGAGLARAAVADGAGLVFAVGGDGTVRACADALAGTGIPLAIVPRGSANLAARALRIPSALGAALETGFDGQQRVIDLATADGMTFVAMAGIGLDAAIVGATPDLLKRRASWLAYPLSAPPQLLRRRRLPFQVRLDGGDPLDRRAAAVVAGNAGLLPGGFVLLRGARLDDGVLDVGILAPAGPLGWVRVAHRVLTRAGGTDPHLERHLARHVEIRADAPLPRQVDGEIITAGRSLTIAVRPAALTVCVRRQR